MILRERDGAVCAQRNSNEIRCFFYSVFSFAFAFSVPSPSSGVRRRHSFLSLRLNRMVSESFYLSVHFEHGSEPSMHNIGRCCMAHEKMTEDRIENTENFQDVGVRCAFIAPILHGRGGDKLLYQRTANRRRCTFSQGNFIGQIYVQSISFDDCKHV